jgi:hypothetical protein
VFDPACWVDFGAVGWAAGSFVLWGVGLFGVCRCHCFLGLRVFWVTVVWSGWFWFLVSGGVRWVGSRWVGYVYDVVAGWALVFVFGCRRVPGSGYAVRMLCLRSTLVSDWSVALVGRFHLQNL